MASFTIKASPGTDIWRKPPSTDVFNAPRAAHVSNKTTAPLSTFQSAQVSFLLHPKEQYDQAGLVLSLRPAGAAHPSSVSGDSSPPKWLKTGVEYYNGVPKAATVACDSWADWSLSDVKAGGGGGGWVTVLVESGSDELGQSLWVYQVLDGEKVPLREVCWVFGHGGPDKWEVAVEAYACRPEKGTEEELSVEFRDFDVKWA
ncbi:hypothetical protein VSDG_02754 [Cytospora chrysosperma]|uniref:Uncharacterized protein n=1 Tax=Cytospora chrysosperma TaxID=252740 RepID=A0A423WCF7_CYTCH|nr:hypothetical protein VSDG_02754 [Valsa sordida]